MLYSVDFRDGERGWVVGERGGILRTIDGGENWEAVNPPTLSTLLSVRFISDDNGWAVGRSGTILRTGDGGADLDLAGKPYAKESLCALHGQEGRLGSGRRRTRFALRALMLCQYRVAVAGGFLASQNPPATATRY
ncbi:MAG: YCF48-related protein [Pyrinomonadaceae bacterium]